MITELVKKYTFWFYCIIGLLNILAQIIIHLDIHNAFSDIFVYTATAGLLFGLWLTFIVPICYLLGVTIDKYRSSNGQEG